MDADRDIEATGALSAVPGQTGPASGTGPAAALGSGIHRELPSGSALLIVHRGPSEGSEFLLPAELDIVRVGRSPESEVFLDDVTVCIFELLHIINPLGYFFYKFEFVFLSSLAFWFVIPCV